MTKSIYIVAETMQAATEYAKDKLGLTSGFRVIGNEDELIRAGCAGGLFYVCDTAVRLFHYKKIIKLIKEYNLGA